MRKRKSRERERSRREKSNGCTIIVFVIATLFLAEKDCWTQKGLFGDKVFKYPTRKKKKANK